MDGNLSFLVEHANTIQKVLDQFPQIENPHSWPVFFSLFYSEILCLKCDQRSFCVAGFWARSVSGLNPDNYHLVLPNVWFSVAARKSVLAHAIDVLVIHAT